MHAKGENEQNPIERAYETMYKIVRTSCLTNGEVADLLGVSVEDVHAELGPATSPLITSSSTGLVHFAVPTIDFAGTIWYPRAVVEVVIGGPIPPDACE